MGNGEQVHENPSDKIQIHKQDKRPAAQFNFLIIKNQIEWFNEVLYAIIEMKIIC